MKTGFEFLSGGTDSEGAEKTKFNLYPKSGWIKDLEGKEFSDLTVMVIKQTKLELVVA